MERIELVFQAAYQLRARLPEAMADNRQAGNVVEELCLALGLMLLPVSQGDAMLGGSGYARLYIPDHDAPENGCTIWVREETAPEKRHFAIAHELGHYILHRGEGFDVHAGCDEREIDEQTDFSTLRTESHRVEEYTPRARRELEANAFAAELLAPRAQVRRLFAYDAQANVPGLAAKYGISPTLAYQRLVDAVFLASLSSKTNEGTSLGSQMPEQPTETSTPDDLLDALDPSQRAAAVASTPALVIAGPGTGKTATLVGRVAHLIGHRGLHPEHILALTFSNRAAGEMRERLTQHGLPGERMPVMTIHAFAANLLREYASYVPSAPDEQKLTPDFRILDQSDAFLLMEELLGELPLHYYRSLGNPTRHVPMLLEDFSRARDQLLTPAAYLALVEAMPPVPPATSEEARDAAMIAESTMPATTFTTEQIARARERALTYGIWDRALRKRGLVDFGGLIQRAVELLRAHPVVLAEVRQRYQRVLVDEFQDTNPAAAEFLLLVAGNPSQELWVVGDRNQSIYRWRGASPSTNLRSLIGAFPSLRVFSLRSCYRSVPPIVQLGSRMAARMAELLPTPPASSGARGASLAGTTLADALAPLALEPHRQEAGHAAVLESVFLTPGHEALGLSAAIRRFRTQGIGYSDQAILCRSHKQAYRLAARLAAEGIPVRQTGDFFERPEIKDVLALVALAAGPDARGLLRAGALAEMMGERAPSRGELASLILALAQARQALPGALTNPAVLASVPALATATRQMLAALGEAALGLRAFPNRVPTVEGRIGLDLVTFLLRPGGYAWHLVRVADGFDEPRPASASTSAPGEHLAALESRQRAQAALAALGELIRLATRFDVRWNREPDFRTRLSRAVAHWYHAPRTAEPPGEAQRQAEPASSQVVLDAPPVRCFLHYLDALRAAQAVITVPAAEDDAVHVLTLHASKGLEFRAVYLPGLVQGQFPPSPNAHEEVCPPGFREADAPGERQAEERCLFYVGVTRARDVIAFSRPTTDGKRRKAPSLLLELIEGALSVDALHPLLPEEELTALAARAGLLEEQEETPEDEPEGETTLEDVSPPVRAQAKGTFHINALEQYLECPRQYKYAQTYQLLDPAQNAVYRFHRYVRRALTGLRQAHQALPEAPWAMMEEQLRLLWEDEGPAGHAYDAFYWQRAQAILCHEWKKLSDEEPNPSRQVTLAERLSVELNRCLVQVTADRVTSTTNTSLSAPTVLSRLHTGRPRKSDADDLRLPLYYLGHQQRQGATPVRIELSYLGNALADAAPQFTLPLQSGVIDVTENARKVVEKYLKPGRKQVSRLDKLDRAAEHIEAGQFMPRPDDERCATCPYFYVCPADPEARQPE